MSLYLFLTRQHPMKYLMTLAFFSGLFFSCQAKSDKMEAGNPQQQAKMIPTASIDSARLAQAKADRKIIEDYLTSKGIGDARRTESGLYYTVQNPGTGAKVEPGNTVKVHYTGKLLDGTVFDSSVERGEPLAFPIGAGRVIAGWDEGIPLFNVGGKGTLYIPSELAYGTRGFPGSIPPNSVLIFEIEVVGAFDQAKADREAKATGEQAAADYAGVCGVELQKTASGLYYFIEKPGSGEKPQNGQTVSVHYTGKFTDGKVFDSSVSRGEPITFPLGQGRVIRGWDEGLTYFPKGAKGLLVIPPHLGYGAAARGPIPANSVLVFEVEMVDIQ